MNTINIQTKQFQQDLTNLVNHSGLPIVNAYYVVKDIYQQLEALYEQQVAQEMQNAETASENNIENEEQADE